MNELIAKIKEMSDALLVDAAAQAEKGNRFAQLLLLPYVPPLNKKTDTRTGGFESTTAALSTVIKKKSIGPC